MTIAADQTTGWVPDLDNFGARLALVRQHMSWGNVKEAALACGQPVSSWRNWERDGRRPRDYMAICRAISAKTGVDLGWLVGMAGLPPGWVPHSLRHRAGTDWYAVERDLFAVQELLGHARADTTRIYVETPSDARRRAVTAARRVCRPGWSPRSGVPRSWGGRRCGVRHGVVAHTPDANRGGRFVCWW